ANGAPLPHPGRCVVRVADRNEAAEPIPFAPSRERGGSERATLARAGPVPQAVVNGTQGGHPAVERIGLEARAAPFGDIDGRGTSDRDRRASGHAPEPRLRTDPRHQTARAPAAGTPLETGYPRVQGSAL